MAQFLCSVYTIVLIKGTVFCLSMQVNNNELFDIIFLLGQIVFLITWLYVESNKNTKFSSIAGVLSVLPFVLLQRAGNVKPQSNRVPLKSSYTIILTCPPIRPPSNCMTEPNRVNSDVLFRLRLLIKDGFGVLMELKVCCTISSRL